jgi:hypothetical protein
MRHHIFKVVVIIGRDIKQPAEGEIMNCVASGESTLKSARIAYHREAELLLILMLAKQDNPVNTE